MGFFRRQKKVSPQKMASEMWNAQVSIMEVEIDQAKKWDREKFLEQEGFDYDKKSMLEEYPYILIMITLIMIESHFPEKEEEILDELEKIFLKNEMPQQYMEGALEYDKVWLGAEERSKIKNDDSPLNNPIYCVSKLASIRCFGEKEGLDPTKIIMFSGMVKSFFKWFDQSSKHYKVV